MNGCSEHQSHHAMCAACCASAMTPRAQAEGRAERARVLACIAADALERVATALGRATLAPVDQSLLAQIRREAVAALERLRDALAEDDSHLWALADVDARTVAGAGPSWLRERAAAWCAFAEGAS